MSAYLERGAGILLPISSLPSPYGIGTLGESAFLFVRQLKEAGQKYWQVLPVGPTSYGDSPYQSFSAFAGNPYFIDLDLLKKEGLIEDAELQELHTLDKEYISYETLWEERFPILKKAYTRFGITDEFEQFRKTQQFWLEDYALFMACKEHFGQKSWLEWEDSIRYRTKEGLENYTELLTNEINFWMFIQFTFYKQWKALKEYANSLGIKIIGDIPIYVAMDSADIWMNPKDFQMNEEGEPTCVAGCPPDAFSEDGQKWGNPLYDWKAMEENHFSWWRKRMKASAERYDIIRIDHFIGIVRYYVIPIEQTAKEGWYEKGPGEKLIQAIKESIGNARIIAEDLGVLTDEVKLLLEKSGFPGMKVLEFAFENNPDNMYLPHNYIENCVVYGGTHDNDTLSSYFEKLNETARKHAILYCGATGLEDIVEKAMEMLYRSVADVVILQMQDILQKGNAARMNLPSTLGQNWKWRLQEGEFAEEMQLKLRELAEVFGRI
ncbi:4-alpha-glucanotransferase [[Clostridium] polysaccharolyticum]|uniref:4-alpha-glucanotransferase n=1 Tax=[Clostridium] polysaccharolyticum TaxID=29364 RepID=A0A1I0G5Y7_9FIRM|nr:4-alpha-glucanotransferase [[Clostridium] polysaccharolyticum]SET65340.1 4-alpha-glucanotransferase [[Clostridium] polysaccharolyticum]